MMHAAGTLAMVGIDCNPLANSSECGLISAKGGLCKIINTICRTRTSATFWLSTTQKRAKSRIRLTPR